MARTAKKAAPKASRSTKATKGAKAVAKTSASKKAAKSKAAVKKSSATPKKAPAKKPAPKKVAKKIAKKVAKTLRSKAPAKSPKVSAKPAKAPAEKPEKKVAAAKAAPAPVEAPPNPKKPQKPEVTPKMIQSIRETLEQQRASLFREFTDLEEGTFSLSQSDMSGEASFDEEYADAGSYTFEREKDLSIGNNIRDLLEKVTHALDRIDRGTYGLCENCGDPINKDRLLALPYSTLCIRCKQREERTR